MLTVRAATQRAGLLVLALGCTALAVCGQAAKSTTAAPQTVYVKAGHLFDATSDKLRDNVVLVVEGERISKVAPARRVDHSDGSDGGGSFEGLGAAGTDRLPHAS